MNDNLNQIIWACNQAKEKGEIISIEMSGQTLRNLTLSDNLYDALEQKGYKELKPSIIDKNIIEFILGGHIVIDHHRNGVKIRTENNLTVKFE